MESAPAQPSTLTPTQRRVVEARGNVLVMAGAGTGKTRTLIDRCIHCLEHDSTAIDELLIVTFTEAAAAEMRERLRRAIETRCEAEADSAAFWAEQLARFDLAHIGTLHSFCFQLVREHFYELGLDPHLTVLAEGEARQMANETLDDQFTAHYAGKTDFSGAVLELIQIHGGGRDDAIRQLVLQLHHYSQARPDAAGWLAEQRKQFASPEPINWKQWLAEAIVAWRDEWLPVLENLKGENEKAAELAGILSRLDPKDSKAFDAQKRAVAAEALGQVVAAAANWPNRRKTVLRKPIADIFAEAEFLHSLAEVKNGIDPLMEDWGWVRGQMETLLRLAEEFAHQLAERQLGIGALDFHDLEQFALKLLWDFSTGKPTAVAGTWRAKLKFIFVDEYQDINAAQDKIIQGLSRDSEGATEPNRFLVGDVKQSIYRFRLADPKIFRDYARSWREPAGQTIPLSDNFRSRESLLRLVNSVFGGLMREEIGGIAYDADAALKFGSPETRVELSAGRDASPRTELLIRFKNGRGEGREDEGTELANLDDGEREARLVACRLRQLMSARAEIFDDQAKIFRPVEWRDMAILLRSPGGRSEIYAKEFELAGIPLAVARGGFYESAEILDLLSLLQLLDNPLQDVPCIAVLRSPLVGLSLDELAEIRLAATDRHFWTALNRSAIDGTLNPDAAAKVTTFLDRVSRWRKFARLVSLSQCLDGVLAETLYADWLRAQPRGPQRAANVTGFLHLAHQFDQFQRQGLFRFLKFIEAQREAEAEPEVPAQTSENAVRLMSIHQSKGLEFPVVVLADLAKQFNERDLHSEIIFDEQYGPCPKIKPPQTGRRYPSLPHWLAQRRQKRELRGEELRLLYVALTRARDQLILTASISTKAWDEKWRVPQPLTLPKIAAAKSFADWFALWFSNQIQPQTENAAGQTSGAIDHLRWQVMADEAGQFEDGDQKSEVSGQQSEGDSEALTALRARLEWSYPHQAATQRRAKTSVTGLRRESQELDDEAEPLFPDRRGVKKLKPAGGSSHLTAAQIGAAHHKFLQFAAFEKTDDLAAEAGRLAKENYLSPEEHGALDLTALATFWTSPLGRNIRAHAREVRRELPFTARFSPAEIAAITGVPAEPGLADEFVVVQGVADLVVILTREIWLIDFKTDEVSPRSVAAKVKIYGPQIKLYAAALEKMFSREVTVRALHFLAAGQTKEV